MNWSSHRVTLFTRRILKPVRPAFTAIPISSQTIDISDFMPVSGMGPGKAMTGVGGAVTCLSGVPERGGRCAHRLC